MDIDKNKITHLNELSSSQSRKVILAMTESDAHVVANQLIELFLSSSGFEVINLGACTSLEELLDTYQSNKDSLSIVIGSINGHAYQDLKGLFSMTKRYVVTCPIVLGGNLSVGAGKKPDHHQRLYDLGVTHILNDKDELLELLCALSLESTVAKLKVVN